METTKKNDFKSVSTEKEETGVRRNIYIPPEKVSVYENLAIIAKNKRISTSQLIIKYIEQGIEQENSSQFSEITLIDKDWKERSIPTIKRAKFIGKLIASRDEIIFFPDKSGETKISIEAYKLKTSTKYLLYTKVDTGSFSEPRAQHYKYREFTNIKELAEAVNSLLQKNNKNSDNKDINKNAVITMEELISDILLHESEIEVIE